MTIGDVLAFVGFIGSVCLSLWVLLIGVALLFESKAAAARRVLENEAGRTFCLGIVLLLPLGFAAIALINAPGILKLIGFLLIAALLALSLLGGAGLALLMGERTGSRAPEISSFSALSRGAGMMSLAWLFPVLGWFLVAPVSIIAGLGAGAKALRKKHSPQENVLPVRENLALQRVSETVRVIASETTHETPKFASPEAINNAPIFASEALVFEEKSAVVTKEEL